MPRTILLGNGRLTVCMDVRGSARDLYFPMVGLHNHLSGYKIRFGVWCDGHFSWTDEGDWRCEQSYREGTNIALQKLTSNQIQLHIETEDQIQSHDDIWLRNIRVTSLSDRTREVRFFTTHDLRIEESDIGDCAYWDPTHDGVIHHKGFSWFLIRWQNPYEYTTGVKAFGNLEGSWRDAEDGHLAGDPIAQGSVDSTISTGFEITPGAIIETSWSLCSAESYAALSVIAEEGIVSNEVTPDSLANPELPTKIQQLFDRSIRCILMHCDRGGAMIASLDSDIMATNRSNYCYFWPRDGAHIASALMRVKHSHPAHRMLSFCGDLISDEQPYFLQKYRPDQATGASWHPWVVGGKPALPIQLDESALILAALREFADIQSDLAEELWSTFGKLIADFLVEYRDPETRLPGPSWDLWEERRGFHAVTAASVSAGLDAADSLSSRFGKWGGEYAVVAEEIRGAMRLHLVSKDSGTFIRSILVGPSGTGHDTRVDASLLQLPLLGAVKADDPNYLATEKQIIERLTIHTNIGGLARYEGDYYFRTSDKHAGNPWIITTLWLARVRAMRAKSTQELEEVLRALEWCVERATPTHLLGEQMHPDTGEHLSVSPLAWSHAEFVHAVYDYSERFAAG